MALQGPHHVAKASRMTTLLLAMVSLNFSTLEMRDNEVSMETSTPTGEVYSRCRGAGEAEPPRVALKGSARGRFAKATHDSILWTVILGELVVNDLATAGCLARVGIPRRVVKAGRRSLDVIWGREEAGGCGCADGRSS